MHNGIEEANRVYLMLDRLGIKNSIKGTFRVSTTLDRDYSGVT